MLFAPITTSALWTWTFCALLLGSLLTRLWLSSRQSRHVARHQHTVPTAFAQAVSPEEHHKAARYTLSKTRQDVLEMCFGAAVLIAWTLLGGLDALNQGLRQILGPGLPQQVALLAAFALISGVLDLPFAWYRTFRIEAQFGFNKTTLGLWLTDGVKGTVLGALIGLPLATLVLWLMQATGTWWWLWAWSAWVGFSLLMMVIAPTLIAPLFNKFEPLQDETQKQRIEALLQRCGFSAKGLFVMDGSRRSAHANAYFTGFGPAKRVVFFDTLLQQLSPGEIDAVLAHELGHFKHRHMAKRVVVLLGTSLLGFALLGGLAGQVWFYTGLGVTPALDGTHSALALLLFMSVVPLVSFFVSPLLSQLSRQHEFEADAYAVEHTSGQDLASALLKLYRDNANTLTPDPWYVRFYYSHPPAAERLSHMHWTPA